MPRGKVTNRNTSNKKSRFGGLRLALPGLHNNISTTTTSDSVAIVSTTSSQIIDKTNDITKRSIDENFSWARWSQAEKLSARVDEKATVPMKTLIPKSIKTTASKKNISNASHDNPRYILAVNQGRNHVKRDMVSRTSSEQMKAKMEGNEENMRLTTKTHLVNPSNSTIKTTIGRKRTIRPKMSINNDTARYIAAVNQGQRYSSAQTKVLHHENSTMTKTPEIINKTSNQAQSVQNTNTSTEATRHIMVVENNDSVIKINGRATDTDVHHLDFDTPRNMTEYEYYQQRSAHGGRLGIEERIDVFKPEMTQKFVDDDLESLRLKRVYGDDDTTTVATTQTSNKLSTSASIITQSTTQIDALDGTLSNQKNNKCLNSPSHNAFESDPTMEHMFTGDSLTTTKNKLEAQHFLFTQNEISTITASSQIQVKNVQKSADACKTKSQVNRLIELQNSTEFLNEIASQIKQNHSGTSNTSADHTPIPMKKSIRTSATTTIPTASHTMDIPRKVTKEPTTYTRKQAATEALEIDRLLAMLDPIIKNKSQNVVPTQFLNAGTSKPLPPLHDSPRKKYIIKDPRSCRELGTLPSESSDGDFRERLKEEAFAAFDDDNDEDLMVENPYNNLQSTSFHEILNVLDKDDKCDLQSVPRKDEHIAQHNESVLDVNIVPSTSCDDCDDEVVTQFFQTDIDMIDFETKYEMALNELPKSPQRPKPARSDDTSRMLRNSDKSTSDLNVRYYEKSQQYDQQDITFECNNMASKKEVKPSLIVSDNFSDIFKFNNIASQIEVKPFSKKFSDYESKQNPTSQFPAQDSKHKRKKQPVDRRKRPEYYLQPLPDNHSFRISSSVVSSEHYHRSPTSKLEHDTDVPINNTFYDKNEVKCFENEMDHSYLKAQPDLRSHSKAPVRPRVNCQLRQLEKKGYASAPIRKYWQQYSNVRSGGSFDTVSLRNDGSDELSSYETKDQACASLCDDKRDNLSRPPDNGGTQLHNEKLIEDDVTCTNGCSEASNSNSEMGNFNSHFVGIKASGRDTIHMVPNHTEESIVEIQDAQRYATTLQSKRVKKIEEASLFAERENHVNYILSIPNGRVSEIGGCRTQSEEYEKTSDNTIFSPRASTRYNSINFKADDNRENPHHNIGHVQHESARSGKLFDDEGFSVAPSVRSNNVHQTEPHPFHSISDDECRAKADEIGDRFQVDLNSPGTEFLNFSLASQLSTQEFSTRVQKAISPTKENKRLKSLQQTMPDNVENTWVHDEDYKSVRDNYEYECEDFDKTPISRNRHHNNLSSKSFTYDKNNLTNSFLPYVRNSTSFEQPASYALKERLVALRSNFLTLDKSDVIEKNTPTANEKVKDVHLGSGVKLYPSFDSDNAITDNVVEVLSVTSSEDILDQTSLSLIEAEKESYAIATERPTIPILPPWQQTRLDNHSVPLERAIRTGRPQPGAHWKDTNESIYSKDLSSPLRDTLVDAMSPMLSGDSVDEETVSEWSSSRYDQSRTGQPDSFYNQCCSILACFDMSTLEEQLRTMCKSNRD